MSIHPFGTVKGERIDEIRLSSTAGATASILTWGATLRDLVVPLPDGKQRRVVLGYQDMVGYAVNPNFLGATVGRYANRIAAGRFQFDGQHDPPADDTRVQRLPVRRPAADRQVGEREPGRVVRRETFQPLFRIGQ